MYLAEGTDWLLSLSRHSWGRKSGLVSVGSIL